MNGAKRFSGTSSDEWFGSGGVTVILGRLVEAVPC